MNKKETETADAVRTGKKSDDIAARIWAKPPLAVFLENGHAGLKNADGEVVVPPEWGKVEVFEDRVEAEVPGYWVYWLKSGGSGSEERRDDNHFYRNGKVGLLKDGKVWFDALYDEIYEWGDGFDVVYTRIGTEPRYFTGDHRPVLTEWRTFPEFPEEEAEPYFVDEKQNTAVLVTMEPADAEDARTCRRNGRLYRLDRMLRRDVRPFIEARSAIRDIHPVDLSDFDSDFTYIYSAYSARATGPDAVVECLRSFRDMGCFNSSWRRLVLLSVSPKRTDRLDVTALFRVVDEEAVKGRWWGYSFRPTGAFAAGFDDALAPDEIRIFLVQYFSDHWPAECEFHLGEAIQTWNLRALKRALDETDAFAEDASNFRSSAQQAAFRLQNEEPPDLHPIVPPGRSWRSIRGFCQYMWNEGWEPDGLARDICSVHWSRKTDEETAAIRDNEVRLLKWALAHGDDPNFVRDGRSGLDDLAREENLLRQLGPILDEGSLPEDMGSELTFAKSGPVDERLRLVRELRAVLLRAGARPGAELPALTLPVYLYPRSRRLRYGRHPVAAQTKAVGNRRPHIICASPKQT